MPASKDTKDLLDKMMKQSNLPESERRKLRAIANGGRPEPVRRAPREGVTMMHTLPYEDPLRGLAINPRCARGGDRRRATAQVARRHHGRHAGLRARHVQRWRPRHRPRPTKDGAPGSDDLRQERANAGHLGRRATRAARAEAKAAIGGREPARASERGDRGAKPVPRLDAQNGPGGGARAHDQGAGRRAHGGAGQAREDDARVSCV
eukprot:7375876-Prymnesium_polylepis.2